jgi:AcrR family transcriptional regulator
VLQAAIELADRDGIESLSMRKLGQELGVEAMSLYNHVANKDDILAGMVDLVTAEMTAPQPGGDWKSALRARAISAHEVLVRHRWAAPLVMRVAQVSPARLLWSEGLLKTCREAGFSPYLTHHAYHALESHITGFTLWQVSLPFETNAELQVMATEFLRTSPLDDYPYTLEHIHQHLGERDPDEPSTFEFGLNLILDGLERLRDSGDYA